MLYLLESGFIRENDRGNLRYLWERGGFVCVIICPCGDNTEFQDWMCSGECMYKFLWEFSLERQFTYQLAFMCFQRTFSSLFIILACVCVFYCGGLGVDLRDLIPHLLRRIFTRQPKAILQDLILQRLSNWDVTVPQPGSFCPFAFKGGEGWKAGTRSPGLWRCLGQQWLWLPYLLLFWALGVGMWGNLWFMDYVEDGLPPLAFLLT